MAANSPTNYPEINKILELLLSSATRVLGSQLVGMYLYGSLSSGDFDLETSDIDFLIVTSSTLSDKTIAELETMHHQIWKSRLKWASKLEGSYIPKRDIRRHNPRSAPCPTVNEESFIWINAAVTGSSSAMSFANRESFCLAPNQRP